MANAVIGALRVNLGIDSAAFSTGLKNAQSGLQKFGTMAKQGLMVVGAAAAAAAGAMTLAVKGTIDAADEMSKASSKIGIPIEELSRLKYAADLSGVSFEGLQTAVGRLSRNMNDFAQGSTSAVDMFGQLGISATNADGSLKPTSQVLAEIADRFAKMPDGAEKTALAMELMGRSGANMIPMLNGGAEALGSLMAEADSFGQVFTKEMGANAELFNDNISRLQGAFSNLTAQLATALLPHLANFTNWLVENAPAITNFVVQTVEAFAWFGNAISETIGFFDRLDASIRTFGDRMREMVQSVGAFAVQIVHAFAAIPGQMYQIGADIIAGLWQGIQEKWTSVKEGVTGIATGLVDGIKAKLGIQSPSTVMAGIGVNIMEGLGNGMDSMRGAVTSIGDSIASTLTGAFMSVIDGTKSVGDALKDLLRQVASMWLNNAFRMIFSGLGGGGGGFLSGILKFFGGARANGGPVSGGRAYLVGERGPELMVPNTSGTVVPNHQLGSARGGGTIRLHVIGEEGPMFRPTIRAEAEGVSVQVTQAGIGQYDKSLPGRFGEIIERQG